MAAVYKKTVAGAFIMMFAAAFVTSCLSYFVGPVTKDLGYTRGAFTLYYTLLQLVGMVMMPVAGKLAGKLGVRKITIFGGVWTFIGFVILSKASSLVSFYIAGVFIGFIGMICTSLMAIITVNNWFIAKKGFVMGVVGAASSACGVIAGFAMPALLKAVGWRLSYLVLGAGVFLCTAPVALFLIKDSPQSVGLMPYGYEEKKSVDSGAASKSIPGVPYGKAVKSLPFILLSVSFLIIAYVAGVLQHLPVFFSGEGGKGLTEAQAGSIMSIFMLAMIVAKILMGIMNDKLGLKVTTALILGLFAISCAIMPFLSGFASLACVMIIMSFGFGSASVLTPLITGVIFGQKDFSGIWGILGMSGALGTAVGAPLWGAFYDATGSYNSGFLVAVALLAIAAVLIFVSINSAKSAGWQ